MAASTLSLVAPTRIEDVLAYLPASGTAAYSKGQTIYAPGHASNSIYLVVAGKVGISHVAADASEILLEILRPEELFGESAFLYESWRDERATAIENTKLMTWTTAAVEDLVTKRPRLAVALLQILVQRNSEYFLRIESLACDTVERRLARSLIRFSERLGTPEESGSVWMLPLTHEMLSRYVGASREVIGHHMGRFRSQGHVSYSRLGIRLHREALRTVLD
jgi:CRP/FNR family transcriptional regulator, cyclic AMP receptor protein